MRILVHDFAGHPFQLQLSRELANRGYEVLHLYCASLATTPQGSLEKREDDPTGLTIRGITLSQPINKGNLVARWRQEREYGRLASKALSEFEPDVVVSGNTPLDAQRMLIAAARSVSARFIFWVQDIIGIATRRILANKSRILSTLAGAWYERLERRLFAQSDALVLITEDFKPLLQSWGISTEAIVIENWAPLDELTVSPKTNEWSVRQGLADKRCFIYTGTLGMKHNPELLLQLALHMRDRDDVRVVVTSQGKGADWLVRRKEELELDNILVYGFQPFDEVPNVMGAADVLIAVLEPEAGTFSVPSKVLAYLCSHRPVLVAIPPENLAAKIVKENKAGFVVQPDDVQGFLRRAEQLIENDTLRREFGESGRGYAEAAFDVQTIADRFEAILIPK